MLEEVGDRFELSRVDLAANQQNSTSYLRINAKARARVSQLFRPYARASRGPPDPARTPDRAARGGNCFAVGGKLFMPASTSAGSSFAATALPDASYILGRSLSRHRPSPAIPGWVFHIP